MALVQDGPYDSRTLTKVFAWTSILLLLSIVWMVIADHTREWKTTQEEFRELEILKRRAALTAEKEALRSRFALTLRKKTVRGEYERKGDHWTNRSDPTEEHYHAFDHVEVADSLDGLTALTFKGKPERIGNFALQVIEEGDTKVSYYVNKDDETQRFAQGDVEKAEALDGQTRLKVKERLIISNFLQEGTSYIDRDTKTKYSTSDINGVVSLEDHLKILGKEAKAKVELLNDTIATWEKKLADEVGQYQAIDLEFKNLKSNKEAAAFKYEHAKHLGGKDTPAKYEIYKKLGAEEALRDGERQIIETFKPHAVFNRDNTLNKEIDGKSYPAQVVGGPFRGFNGSILNVEGFGSLSLLTQPKRSQQDQVKYDAATKAKDNKTVKAMDIVRANAARTIAAKRKELSAYITNNFVNSQPIWVHKNDRSEIDEVYLPVFGTAGIKSLLSTLRGAESLAVKNLAGLVAERKRLAGNLRKIDHTFANEFVWNQPMVDFIAPTLKAKQIVIEDLRDDYFFAQIRKVDRCETCHLAIDKDDYDGWLVNVKGRGMVAVKNVEKTGKGSTDRILTHYDGKKETLSYKDIVNDEVKQLKEPFTSHPRLDLFLTDGSPHPKETFGCTVCHSGEGRSMDFHFSAHTPQNAEEKKRWEKEHHYHARHHWDHPQVRAQYIESSCLKCHANNRPVEGAPKLNFGREIWERVSCYGCHKMQGFTQENKKGPDLRRLASKLDEGWVYSWLANPENYRPKTNMPRFWFAADAEHALEGQVEKDSAEIVAVTKYLFAMSKEFKLPEEAKTPKGSAKSGLNLFAEKGCVGCHRLDSNTTVKEPRTYAPNEYGPNLFNIGDKTSYAWLYSWLKNPKDYWTHTNMPNLQLTTTEAHDMAAYLSSLKVAKEPAKLPKADKAVVKELCENFLNTEFSPYQTEQILNGQSGNPVKFPEMGTALNLTKESDRLLYLGRQMVGRYGCFGCHLVTGMETRPGIGAELSNIGDKALDKIDWGHTSKDELPHQREDWIQYKVKDPRYPDHGKETVLGYLDRSRMPRFNLTNAEREALVTFLSGHTEKEIPAHYKYKPTVRKKNANEGAYQIYRKNCKACHIVGLDQITVRKYNEPGDDPEDDLEVAGKTVEDWVEVLEDGEDMAERLKSVEALASVKAFTVLREFLEGMDLESETAGLRLTLENALHALRKARGSQELTVKGLVLVDNRYQTDLRTGAFKTGPNGPLSFPLKNEDGEILKAGDQTLTAKGIAVIQVYEDGNGKEAGTLVPVSASLAADPTVFYADIVKIVPGLVGAEAKIPEDLKKRFPDDFAVEGSVVRTRYRGGATVAPSSFARLIAKIGKDPRALKSNFNLGALNALTEPLGEARSYTAPHLLNEGEKVQVGWLRSFLSRPSIKIRPWLVMRMPDYGFNDVEAQKIAYFFSSTQEEVVVDRAQKAIDSLKAEMDADKLKGTVWSRSKIVVALGKRLGDIGSGAAEYYDFTIADGVLNFRPKGQVTILNTVEEKTDSFRDSKEIDHPYWYSKGHELFVASQCLSCHLWDGRKPGKDDPSSWGPDLSRVRERIRPDWFHKWVDNPAKIIPGTKMSQQFTKGYPEILNKPIKDQIDCLKDWIYAGMKPALEVFPKEISSGQTVRVSSQLFSLDNLDTLYVTSAAGTKKYTLYLNNPKRLPRGDEFVKEESSARAAAFSLRISGKPGVFSISTSDPTKAVPPRDTSSAVLEFQGRAQLTVKK
jgi:cbb3-type cytochrome oxidase cytochrome c subunit